MSTVTLSNNDALVRFGRRGLWLALGIILLLGADAVIFTVFPSSAAALLAGKLLTLLPIAIIIAIASMRASLKGRRVDPASPAMQAVLNDELRQASLARAYRNGLATALLAQPTLALILAVVPTSNPALAMAGVTLAASGAVVLASMLYYDR